MHYTNRFDGKSARICNKNKIYKKKEQVQKKEEKEIRRGGVRKKG